MKKYILLIFSLVFLFYHPNLALAHKGSTYTCEVISRVDIYNDGSVVKNGPRPSFVLYHKEQHMVIRHIGWGIDRVFKKKEGYSSFNEVQSAISGSEVASFWVKGRDPNGKGKLEFRTSENYPNYVLVETGKCLEN